MTTKPVRTRTDYDASTKRLRELILENRDGSLSDEVEVLRTLIEKYERDTFRIEAPNPIAAIKHRMEQSGLTPRDLEPFVGSRARVSEVLSGKRSLSLDMIRALRTGLGIPYEALIERSEVATPDEIAVSRPVLKKLEAIGLKLSANRVSDFIQSAFGPQQLPSFLARRTRTQRASAKTDHTALLLWQAAALVRAREIKPPVPFDRGQLTEAFFREVAQQSARKSGPRKVKEFLARHGIIFLVNPTLPGTFLDGAAMLLDGETPIVALTLRHDRIDNFWFTLLHELAHIARHYDALRQDQFAFFDDLDLASEDEQEAEADELARDSLIPPHLLARANWRAHTANEDLISLANEAGVHVSIAAGRWQREHSDYRKFSRLIDRNTLRSTIGRGLFDSE